MSACEGLAPPQPHPFLCVIFLQWNPQCMRELREANKGEKLTRSSVLYSALNAMKWEALGIAPRYALLRGYPPPPFPLCLRDFK